MIVPAPVFENRIELQIVIYYKTHTKLQTEMLSYTCVNEQKLCTLKFKNFSVVIQEKIITSYITKANTFRKLFYKFPIVDCTDKFKIFDKFTPN